MSGPDPAAIAEAERDRLEVLIALLARDHRSLSSVRDPADAWRVHVLDSLSGLACEPLRGARRIADIGAGGGFPGLALAIALPAARVELVESVGRKCEFLADAIERLTLTNTGVNCVRAEDWARNPLPAGGREAQDVVTARAVGQLALLIELASPLLAEGGRLVAWKGSPDGTELAAAESACELAAMEPEETIDVSAETGFDHRLLCVYRKTGPTPPALPRRAGVARKRPLGGR